VVSAIIQRETGGNLADIMESIARILRHRFSFLQKVHVLSSEARLSAKIIIALPFCIMAAIRLLNPEYINLLFTDSMGRAMLGGSGALMLLGIVVILRMVKIEI
jgi:tight adherence protein B